MSGFLGALLQFGKNAVGDRGEGLLQALARFLFLLSGDGADIFDTDIGGSLSELFELFASAFHALLQEFFELAADALIVFLHATGGTLEELLGDLLRFLAKLGEIRSGLVSAGEERGELFLEARDDAL